MSYRIICVTLSQNGWHHEHIVEVGYIEDATGVTRYASREQVAAWIVAGYTFYSGRGLFAPKVEAYQMHGTWFIRSTPNGLMPDNLLSQDRCNFTYLGRTG